MLVRAVLICAVLICAVLFDLGIICIPDNDKVIKASTIYLLYLVLFACFILAPVVEAKGGGSFRRESNVL